MSFVYTYSQTSNFPGGLNSSQLISDINAWPVVGAVCLVVNTYGDIVYVNMNVNLTITQKSQLDAAIVAYVYKSNDTFYVTSTGTFGVQTTLNTTQTTNRTINFPDATDTLVGRATADTLTNKTLTDPTDNVLARGLWNASGGSSVSIYASSAPTTGQVIRATDNVTATWQTLSASDIGAGTLAATNGGTGNNVYAVGDILFANTTTTLGRLADVAAGNALISGGVNTAPSWGKIGLTTHVSDTLPAANGGTGNNVYVVGDLLYASGTTTLSRLADVAVGSVLVSGGVGVAPAWGQVNISTSASGILAVANGGTGFGSYSPGDLIYAGAAQTFTRLPLAGIGNALITANGNNIVWGKIGLTTHVSGTLPVNNGGTGLSGYTTGDLIYASGSTTLAVRAGVAVGNALISGGISVAPLWGKIGLTTHISGTLAVGNGGTGTTTLTAGRILQGNGAGAILSTLVAPVGAIVGTTDSQTLTNKTMTAATNAITCRALGTTGADVQVSTAAAPSTGQALIATSATSATWQAITASALTTSYNANTVAQAVSGNAYNIIPGVGFTPSAGTYIIMFDATMGYNDLAGATTQYALFAGGVIITDSNRFVGGSHNPITTVQIPISTMTRQVLNGSTAIDIRVNPGANSATMYTSTLVAIRIA